jgi:hypothetical protein
VARQRTEWRATQPTLDPMHLVFIDESWAKTNMTRPRACRMPGVHQASDFTRTSSRLDAHLGLASKQLDGI